MNTSSFLNINWKDISKGLIMAVLGGVALPLDAMLQTPGFSILTANWSAIFALAANGAVIGFVTYIIKNLASDSQGKVFGKVG